MKTLYRFFAWPTRTLSAALYRFEAVRRFNAWANDLERRHNRRLNAPLVDSLRSAGLNDLATELDSSTR